MSDDVHDLFDRGVAGTRDVDLVSGVWRTSRRRRRNRRLVAGSGIAAVAAIGIVASQWGGAPVDLAPADDTHTSAAPSPSAAVGQLEANQRFIDGVRASGVQVDFDPMESPEWALRGGRQVFVGEARGATLSGDDVLVRVDVAQAIPDSMVRPDRVDVVIASGQLHEWTPEELEAVGGPVLLALPIDSLSEGDPPEAHARVDGFWLNVPGGIGNPHVDYADMLPAWPQVDSVAELAGVFTAALPVSEPMPDIECSASYKNPPFVTETGLTAAAFATANTLFSDAGNCDREALIARAIADGTTITVGEGDLEEQLVIPDPGGAYIGLAGTLTRQATTSDDGELHTFDANGWRVVIDTDGRWVEFSSGHVTYPQIPVSLAQAWSGAPRLDQDPVVWRSWPAGSGAVQVGVEPSQGPCCLSVDGDRFVLVDVNNSRLTYDDGAGEAQVLDLPLPQRGALAVELVQDAIILVGMTEGNVWTAHYSISTGSPQLLATVAHPDSPSVQEMDQLAVDSFGRVWFHELLDGETGDWVRTDDPRQRMAYRPLPDSSELEIVHDDTSVRLIHRDFEGTAVRGWVLDQRVGVEDVELVDGDLHLVVSDGDEPRAVVRLTPDGGEVLGTAQRPVEPHVSGPWEWRSPTSLLLLRASEDAVQVVDLPVG